MTFDVQSLLHLASTRPLHTAREGVVPDVHTKLDLQRADWVRLSGPEFVIYALPVTAEDLRQDGNPIFLRVMEEISSRKLRGVSVAIALATDRLPPPKIVKMLADRGIVVTRTHAATDGVSLLVDAARRAAAFAKSVCRHVDEASAQIVAYTERAWPSR